VTSRWLDARAEVRERVVAMLNQMTFAEKCAQLGGISGASLVEDGLATAEAMAGKSFPCGDYTDSPALVFFFWTWAELHHIPLLPNTNYGSSETRVDSISLRIVVLFLDSSG
jgi:hypothetical protein